MGKEIITRDDVLAAASRGVLEVSADALVTERALESATESGVVIERRPAGAAAGRDRPSGRSPAGPGVSPGGKAAPLVPGPARAPASALAPAPAPPAAPPPAHAVQPTQAGPTAPKRELPKPVAGGDCGLERVIVTAVGRNRPGVLGEIATLVGQRGGDILEVSQRVSAGYFNLVLVVDISACADSLKDFKATLEGASREGHYRILVQHERVFEAMHRV